MQYKAVPTHAHLFVLRCSTTLRMPGLSWGCVDICHLYYPNGQTLRYIEAVHCLKMLVNKVPWCCTHFDLTSCTAVHIYDKLLSSLCTHAKDNLAPAWHQCGVRTCWKTFFVIRKYYEIQNYIFHVHVRLWEVQADCCSAWPWAQSIVKVKYIGQILFEIIY